MLKNSFKIILDSENWITVFSFFPNAKSLEIKKRSVSPFSCLKFILTRLDLTFREFVIFMCFLYSLEYFPTIPICTYNNINLHIMRAVRKMNSFLFHCKKSWLFKIQKMLYEYKAQWKIANNAVNLTSKFITIGMKRMIVFKKLKTPILYFENKLFVDIPFKYIN